MKTGHRKGLSSFCSCSAPFMAKLQNARPLTPSHKRAGSFSLFAASTAEPNEPPNITYMPSKVALYSMFVEIVALYRNRALSKKKIMTKK